MSEFTAEEYEEFDAMARFKLLALIGMISLTANIKSRSDLEEMSDLVENIIPDLTRPVMGMGPAALHSANMRVIMHLLAKLADLRGEPIDVTWQREAIELTSGASGG
ncbi:hypothetical protein AB0F88_40335 [Streptosporangium sp. NPDC023963]|uniref:hypothetical protein n=1 Tax=Streptosporangium sp. NPDC023963 TaxID=3155608 RepID=UPI003413A09F